MNIDRIRNFCIIAHIDHGKSTLADRLLEMTGAMQKREMKAQTLDNMDLERERGITIKAKAVMVEYKAQDGETYVLNLIDTPGHVDFNYEVSRSLAACEGALLIVDASQGVEAQTLANAYLAMDHDLEILPVLNKIDLPGADVEKARAQIEDIIGIPADHAVPCSAKEGIGVAEILEQIVRIVPPPQGKADAPLKALIFDSAYESYRGVIAYIRVVEGVIRKGQKIRLMRIGGEYDVLDLGVMTPSEKKRTQLGPGEVGYLVAGIKTAVQVKVGDTVTDAKSPASQPLAGYKDTQSMVFAGLFTTESNQVENLREALEKFELSDSALKFEPENSAALGLGFRCGFLGLLHMEIVQERLEREYGLDLIATAPSVVYKVVTKTGETFDVDNPTRLPGAGDIETISEPFIRATILVPSEYVGTVMQLCIEKRGSQVDSKYLTPERAQLIFELPLAEVVMDFFDKLKSVTKGYASLDYEMLDYRPGKMVRVDILMNGEMVDALSFICNQNSAYPRGKQFCEKLKKLIPRQMFEIPIQAAIGGKVIARESISAMRKNVIAKCYGGDITRKRKLLEKQKEGKKRMKQVGSVSIPQEAFMAVLQVD